MLLYRTRSPLPDNKKKQTEANWCPNCPGQQKGHFLTSARSRTALIMSVSKNKLLEWNGWFRKVPDTAFSTILLN